MTSSLVFAWILIGGIAAIGIALLLGVLALLRPSGDPDDVKA